MSQPLKERLVAVESSSEKSERDVTNWYRNPDGPEALARIEVLEKALRSFIRWGEAKCPCDNDLPNPCPMCDASIENLEGCKAVDRTFPPRILSEARSALNEGG